MAPLVQAAWFGADSQQWQPPKREPPKSKADLREMLTEAVRNMQPEPKRPPKADKDQG
jgi:hypothetical protein